MSEPLEVTVRPAPGAVVLVLDGVVDRSAADRLTEAYQEGIGQGDPRRVVLDFSATEYINSSGIALVVSILGRARSEGRAVAAVGLSEHYRHIFDITRLSDFISVCDDLDAALVPEPHTVTSHPSHR